MACKLGHLALLCTALCLLQPSWAQNEQSITLPASPAFSILNFEPAAVMRPASAKELATDILNAFDKDGKLLLNLGLETAPYWLKSRPYLTKDQYLNPTPGQAFLQSFMLSAATVKDSVSGNNKLGVGFRFKLFNGQPLPEYQALQANFTRAVNINSAITATKAFIGTTINSKEAALDFILLTLREWGYSETIIQSIQSAALERIGQSDETTENIHAFVEDLNNLVDAGNQQLKKQLVVLSRKRIGFILEIAGASGFRMDGSKKALDRSGVWVTASNFISASDAFNGSVRYLFSNQDSALSSLDAGVSYVKELSRFSLSVEGMFRWYRAEIKGLNSNNQPFVREEKDLTYRLATQAAYRISQDLSINISLGKDFDSPFLSGTGFFSILGFNYTIFNKSKVNLAPERESSP